MVKIKTPQILADLAQVQPSVALETQLLSTLWKKRNFLTKNKKKNKNITSQKKRKQRAVKT